MKISNDFNVDSILESIADYQLGDIHNTTSDKLGDNREVDASLNIDKTSSISAGEALNIETSFEVAHFQNKRPISRQLSDYNDQKLLSDIKNVNNSSFQRDEQLANAIAVEDNLREVADAQLKEDILKEALDRVEKDALLAQSLAKYKLEMSESITTNNLTVNENADIKNLHIEENFVLKDADGEENNYQDTIGALKNAIVKGFSQAYDSSTGLLTSTLEFKNMYSNNDKRPIIDTITSSVNLDLEKFIIDINDVYATKTIVDGVATYEDLDITTLSEAQLAEIDSPSYVGNIRRCLKVTYNTLNNENAGDQKSYVYFEINDIFKSIISTFNQKIDVLNNTIADLQSQIDEIYSYLHENTKSVILRDAENNEIYTFKSFASPSYKGSNSGYDESILESEIVLPNIRIKD